MKYALALLITALCQGKDVGRSRDLSSDDFTRGLAIIPYSLPWWHPDIQWAAVKKVSITKTYEASSTWLNRSSCILVWMSI